MQIVGRTPLRQEKAHAVLTNLRKELEKAATNAPMLSIVDYFHDFSVTPGLPVGGAAAPGRYADEAPDVGESPYRPTGPQPAGAKGPKEPDPLFPEEDASGDTHFRVGLIVTITGDGLSEPNASVAPVGP